MKKIYLFNIVTVLASILLGAYYVWVFIRIWGVAEEEVVFWGEISMVTGLGGMLILLLSHLITERTCFFWQAVPLFLLAFWSLGIGMLQVLPIIFWLSGSVISDKPYAPKSMFWGAVPHIALLLLAVAVLYQILKEWPSAAKKM